MKNVLKQKMKNGESVFGTWCMLPSSFNIDVIARTGLDFVVIDMEHGAMSFQTAEEMVRAAQLHGCQPIIRVGDSENNTILHALETGADAVMVPNVSLVEDAAKIAKATKYFPKGTRGLSPYTRNHNYTHNGLAESLVKCNENVLTGILVEGQEGINNLSQIVNIDGLDLIYLGSYDISQSVGLPGELEHPLVVQKTNECLDIIKSSGKAAGIFSRDIEVCRAYRDMGFNFIAYITDSYGLHTFFTNAVNQYARNS